MTNSDRGGGGMVSTTTSTTTTKRAWCPCDVYNYVYRVI